MHLPVLLNEVMDYLDPKPGEVMLDATLGGGGHAEAILKKISPGGRLIAIDRDPEAVERVKERLSVFQESVIYSNDDFRNISSIIRDNNIENIDGAVFDFGVSSFQIDEADRGFSFMKDGPLDMRFDPSAGHSAKEVVNSLNAEELADIIYNFGEERHSRRIASAIKIARKKQLIETTGQLVEIIRGAVGSKYHRQKIHPAARTFQALRIFVNDELASISEALTAITQHMNDGGRLCVISFHSLEDRIVKNMFREMARAKQADLLVKKPIVPRAEEVRENPRARSAKLRILKVNRHEN